MRIVALITGSIEEQILCFPTLETLKQEYPGAIIDVIANPNAKLAYGLCPYVHEILAFNYEDTNGLADYLNLLGMIRDREYDVAILTESNWALELLLWLNGIPRRIGFKKQSSWFLSNAVPAKKEQYYPNYYHDLLQGLGITAVCPALDIKVNAEDTDWVKVQQQSLGIENDNYIVLFGGEGHYPINYWQNIIDFLETQQPTQAIVVLPNIQESPWLEELQKICPNVKLLSPPDVGKLAAIVKQANLLICTSGIPLVIATGLETQTLALVTPEEKLKLLPANQDRYVGVQASSIADIAPDLILSQIR